MKISELNEAEIRAGLKVRSTTKTGVVVRVDSDHPPFVYLRWEDGTVDGWYGNQSDYEVIVEAETNSGQV